LLCAPISSSLLRFCLSAAAPKRPIGSQPSRPTQSALANDARTRTKQLAEEKDWEKATGIDTADSYQAFVGKYPDGKWAEEARIRIENFNVLGSPATATKPDADKAEPVAAASPTPAPAKVEPPPKAVPAASPAAKPAAVAKPAVAAAAASGGYRIQLGAFSSVDIANKEWAKIKGKYGTQLGGLSPNVVPVEKSTGKLYRLQAPVANQAAARATCSALSAAGQACIVVLPK
jgi:cell division protein FtsN